MLSAGKNPIEIAVADEKNTLLHNHCAYNKVEDVKKIIENEDPKIRIAVDAENSNKETPLHQAVRNNAVDVVRYLVNECSADIHHLDINNCSPVAFAIAYGHVDCLKIMGSKSGNIANQTLNGHPILCFAAHHGYLPIVWYLIQQKADVNALSPRSNTPLYFAVTSQNLTDKPAVIKLLLATGAKITPEILELAKYNVSLYQYLHAEFSRRCSVAISDNNPDAFEKLGGKSIVEIRNTDGFTPLGVAVASNKLTMVIYLVNTCGADLEAKNIAGQTPYEQAKCLGAAHALIKKFLQGAWNAKKRATKEKPTEAVENDDEHEEDKPSKAEKERKRRAVLKKRKQQLQQANQLSFQPKSQQSRTVSDKKDKTELKDSPSASFTLPRPPQDGLEGIFQTLKQRQAIAPRQQQPTPHQSLVRTKQEPAPKAAALSFANIIKKLKPTPVEPPAPTPSLPDASAANSSIPTLSAAPPVIDVPKTASAASKVCKDTVEKSHVLSPIATPAVADKPDRSLTATEEPTEPLRTTPTINKELIQPSRAIIPSSSPMNASAGSISPLALPAPALASAESIRHYQPAAPIDLRQFLREDNVYLPEDTIAWMAWLQKHSFSALSGGAVRDSFKPIPCDPNDLDFYFFNIGRNLMNHAAAWGLSEVFHLCEYVQDLYQCKSSLLPLDINCLGNVKNFLQKLYHFSNHADFTVNSISIWLKDSHSDRAPSTPVTIISFDPNNGWKHLAESILQLCGPKDLEEKRFADDPTIIFRFFRTAFAIRKKDGSMPNNYSHYLSLSQKYAHSLHKTSSMSKISDEFSKCILRGNGTSIINMMAESKILDPLFFPQEDKDRQPLVPSSQEYRYFLNEMKEIDRTINQIDFRNMHNAKRDAQLSIYRSQIYGIIIGLCYLDFARKVGGIHKQDFIDKMNKLLTHYNVLCPRKLDSPCLSSAINKTILKNLAPADQRLQIASSCDASMFSMPQASAANIKQTLTSPPSPA